jgi:anti-anti-sigma factor
VGRHDFSIATTAHLDGAELTLAHRGPVCVIHACGEIDIVNAEQWQKSLTSLVTGLPVGTTGLVVDLSGVLLLSAFGMRSLLAAAAAAPDGLRVVVVARSSIRRALGVVDRTRQLAVVSALDVALTACSED